MLLNIDKPHRTGTLHSDDCSFVPVPFGTQFNPRGSMGRDGGWFVVADRHAAEAVLGSEFPLGSFVRCQNC